MSTDRIGEIFREAIALDQPARARLLETLPEDERQQVAMLLDADSMGDESGLFVSLRDDAKEQLPPEPSSLTNKRIRDYDLLEIIGEGGMGTVYRAHHSKLRCDVALKVLPLHRVSGEDTIARFEREMAAVGQLRHPNIVQAMDAGEERGLHYLVLEFVDGSNLATISRSRGQLDVADACEVIRQTAQGLAHAHDSGLVHRDIKPSNLLVSKNGDVCVADLGLAVLQTGAIHLTTAGQIVGTIDYIAPEQIDDPRGVDARADLYSLGCTFYQLLTGCAPFDGPEFGTAVNKLRAQKAEVPKAIADFRDDVPQAVVDIVRDLMRKSPDNRLQSAAELIAQLTPFTKGADLRRLVGTGDLANRTAVPTQRLQGGSTGEAANRPAARTAESLVTASAGTQPRHETVPANGGTTNETPAPRSALKKVLIGLGGIAAVAAMAFVASQPSGSPEPNGQNAQQAPLAVEPKTETPPVVAAEPSVTPAAAAATPVKKSNDDYEEAVKRAFQNGVTAARFRGDVWTYAQNVEEFLKYNESQSNGMPPLANIDIDTSVPTAAMALMELKQVCRIDSIKLIGQGSVSDSLIHSIDVPALRQLLTYPQITDRQLGKLPVAAELLSLQMRGPVEPDAHEQRVGIVLQHFPNLKELELNADGMSVDTLRQLQQLKLNRLGLYEPSVEVLAALSEFHTVRFLDLRTQSREETTDWFAKLPEKLQGLYIHGFHLTVGESDLKAMRRYRLMQVLQLNCNYSADGLEALRASNPNCIVHLRRQP